MIVQSLTIDRSSIALADLVITNNPFVGDYWLSNGMTRPDMDYRRTYAPDSPFLPGRDLLVAVLDASTLPVTIYCQGTTTAALRAAEAVLSAAVSQFAFDVTLTVDGVEVFALVGEPSRPVFGEVDSGMEAAHISRALLTIPVNPA